MADSGDKIKTHIGDFSFGKNTPKNFLGHLSSFLSDLTGIRWLIKLSDEEGQLTIKEKLQEETRAMKKKIQIDPVVSYVLESMPGSVIRNVYDINDNIVSNENNENNENDENI